MSQSEPWGEDEKDKIKHESLQRAGWKTLFGFTTKKHLPFLSAALIASIIAGLAVPAQSILYGLVFNQFANFGSGKISGSLLAENVSNYCLYMVAVGAVNWIANTFYFMSWLVFGELQARTARDRIFNSLLRKDTTWYESRRSGIGAFLSALQTEVRDIQLGTSQPMGEGLQCIVACLAAIGIAFYFSWDLTLIIICTVPVVYLIMGYLSTRLSKRAHEQGDCLQEAMKYLTNAIQNIEMVKCFNGEQFELRRYEGVITRAAKLFNSQANLRSIQLGSMQFITFCMFVQGFWYGSSLVLSGKKSSGEVVTTFWAALLAVQGVTGFLPQFIVIQKGKVAGARIQAMLGQIRGHETGAEMTDKVTPTRCRGDIHFKQVTFAYPSLPDQPALRDASIFFPAGETTFVIGRSGSGKSTIAQLLVRLYEPSSGEISIDGVSLQDLDINWLRKNVTFVEQRSVLFRDTIYANIALAQWDNPAMTTEDVSSAAKFALLDQMIAELPDGLQTMVGSEGNSLSGGQRQRVALARAKLRDTPILILDESTSALDSVTRSFLLEALREWRRGKTTIVITHDHSQILPDDFVYILDQSRVVQEGYRGAMEEDDDTVFEGFTVTESEDKDGQDLYHAVDEVISLYSDSWDPNKEQDQEPHTALYSNLNPRRESVVPQIISPYWSFLADIEDGRSSRRSSLTEPRPAPRPIPLGLPSPVVETHPDLEWRLEQPPHVNRQSKVYETEKSPHIERHSKASDTHSVVNQNLQRDFTSTPWKKRLKRQKRGDAVDKPSIIQILKTVWPKLDWRSRAILLAALLSATVHSAATPAFSYVFARLLSTFYLLRNQQQMALVYVLGILGISIIDGIATYNFHFLFEYCAQVWVNGIKRQAYGRLMEQPREFFDREENRVSRLAETLDHFAEEARHILGRFVGIIFVVLFMLTMTVIWSLVSCWKLTLVAVATAPIIYSLTAGYKAVITKWEKHSSDADESIGVVLQETFINIRTVRCLVLEEVFRRKFTAATKSALKIGIKRAIYAGGFFGINYSSIFFLAAFLFWYGATIVASGEFNTTQFLQAAILLLMSASYTNFIVNMVPQIGAAHDGATRLLRLANLPRDSPERSGTVRLLAAKDVSLKNVNFAYPTRPHQPVLHDVSFKIPYGSCTAIVGSTGSGKSTIAALLMKLYQTPPQRSVSELLNITVSGIDIKQLHTATLRSHIAIVSQTPVLFPGTIADNIAYGLSPSSPYTSLESIRAAALAAGIDEFIQSLPLGYQTIVGEGGTGLSGGQAQRMAIARALVRRPNILILDEATSALDGESAGVVRDTIHRLVMGTRSHSADTETGTHRDSTAEENDPAFDAGRRGMTVIIITHSRDMMAIAEHIVMLDKGRVIEEGSFEELKYKRGPFARLLRPPGSRQQTQRSWKSVNWKGKEKEKEGEQ